MADWYNNAPENAALRSRWGAFPAPDEFQTWPGFVAVTNAFLDREAGEPSANPKRESRFPMTRLRRPVNNLTLRDPSSGQTRAPP